MDREGSERNAMWDRLKAEHRRRPFALMLHGGDQVYADEVTEGHELSQDWPERIPRDPSRAALEDLRHHLRDRHLLASDPARFGVADFDAGPAACAFLPVGRHAFGIPGDRSLRAHRYASAAPDAPVWPKHQFRLWGLALGVVTPPATQGTTFEEDGRANAWAIVNGELLNVKDSPFDQNRYFSCVDRPNIQKTPSSGGHCPFEYMFWAWL